MEEKENNKAKEKLIKKKLKSTKSFSISNIFFCFKFISTLFTKCSECTSKFSILSQYILYLIPTLIIISGLLIVIHIFLFSEILKFDFYTVIKEEFLRYFITDLDDINYDLNKKRVSLFFEDISNSAFFKIYLEELNSYGLLNKDNEKIFPNISDFNQSLYSSLEQYNTIFSIPQNMSYKYIDSRNDSLSELAKIYYYFYPLIASEANSAHTSINQTFLIAYEVNDKNETQGNELYFNFPRITDDFIQNNNFYPYNNLISPRVSKVSNCSDEENEEDKEEQPYIHDNWFLYYDCRYRVQNTTNYLVNFFHLNENNRGSINKTNVISMHSHLYNNESKKYVINIIFFMGQKKIGSGPFEDSVFIVNNYTYNKNKKYSDDQTYVINNNDITEVTLSSQLDQYFHYGLSSKNYNFFSEGVFYDNIDINELYEPSNKYSTIDGFEFDLRYFSSFYLYTKLFEKSFYTSEYMETDHINYYIFNSSQQINEICSNFDYNSYIDSLNSNDINCFNEKNLLYYSRDNMNSFFSEGLTLPYCICLPLYCIKNLKSDFDRENPEFAEEIILPEKCQNNLLYYNNEIENDNGEIVNKDITKIDLRIGENLDEQLESQYIKFSHEKKEVIGGLNFVTISIIDNDDMETILVEFVEKLNKISSNFMLIIIFGTILIFFLISTLIGLYIYSISNIIYEYKSKAYFFLKKLTDKTELQKKSDENTLSSDKNNYESFPLLLNENNYEKNIEENELIDDLYKIYSEFNKLSENDLLEEMEKRQKNKNLVKINILNKSNELFKLFVKLSMYIPQFKLDISIDYDFYKDSKLIQNFVKNYSKKSNNNEDKDQILYTKSILKELLSTELVNDYGFITNLNFNYITNINWNKRKDKKNYIQNAIFKKVEEMGKKKMNEDFYERNIVDNFNVENIKIVFKNKNLVMKKIEEKFEQDDYLNLSKLESSFNSTLINSFYNYTKKIITEETNS